MPIFGKGKPPAYSLSCHSVFARLIKCTALVFFFLFFAFLTHAQSSGDHPKKRETQKSNNPSLPSSAVAPSKSPDGPTQDDASREYQVSVSKMTDVAMRRDLLDWLMLFCTVILASAGAVGTYYAIKTLRVLRHEAKIAVAALRQTAKFAKAAKVSADTSERALALATETAQKQLRAYILVESACVKFPRPDVPEAQVHLKNVGQTPAYNVRGWIHTWFAAHPLIEVLPEAPFDLSKGTEPLAPSRQTVFISPKKPPIKPECLPLLGTSQMTIYVYGMIQYSDAFGNEQWTKYRLVYGGSEGTRKVPNKDEWFLSPDTQGNEAS